MVPMLFPILGAQISEAKFQYPDHSWKEMCGMMGNLVADSGCNKGQLSNVVEALCRNLRAHDDEELEKLVEWQKMMKTKSANKEKPLRPDVAFWFPPSDVTNAAFIQNAMGCEKLGVARNPVPPNMPGGGDVRPYVWRHKQVSRCCNIYDRHVQGTPRTLLMCDG